MKRRHLAGLGLLLPALAAAQTVHTGTLAPGDAVLSGGEYVDSYEVDLQAGQPFEAELTSSDFDPYLLLRAPSGAQEINDDYLGSTMHSWITTTAAETGTYTVAVTSYASGATGSYRLSLEAGRAPVFTPPLPPPAEPALTPTGSAPASGRSITREAVVGHWVGGAPAATQYADRTTGALAPTNGVGTTLGLAADGSFRQSRVMNQTTYGCTSVVNVDETGTYTVEGDELILRRQSGRSWGQVCGGAPYDRTLDPETKRFAVSVAPGRGGVLTLTRHADGEVFDELERSR